MLQSQGGNRTYRRSQRQLVVRYLGYMFNSLEWRPKRTILETRLFISLSHNSSCISCLLLGTQTPYVPLLCLLLGVRQLTTWSLLQPVGRTRREGQDTALPLQDMTQKLYMAPLFVSDWPEHIHIVIPSCKGGQEILSLLQKVIGPVEDQGFCYYRMGEIRSQGRAHGLCCCDRMRIRNWSSHIAWCLTILILSLIAFSLFLLKPSQGRCHETWIPRWASVLVYSFRLYIWANFHS